MATAALARLGSQFVRVINVDQRRSFERDAIAVVAVGFAVFTWIALASFQPTQTWLYAVSPSTLGAKNIAGTFGNSLAGVLFFYFGIIAWAMPVMLIQFAGLTRRAAVRENGAVVLAGWSALFFALMPLLVSIRPTIAVRGYSFATGGALGQVISDWLEVRLGGTGTQVALWTLLLAALLLITRLALVDLKTLFLGTGIAKRFAKGEADASEAPDLMDKLAEEAPAKMVEKTATPTSEPGLFEAPMFPVAPLNVEPERFVEPEKEKVKLVKQTPSLSLDEETSPDHAESDLDQFAPKLPYTPPALDIFKRSDERVSTGLSQKELETTGQVLTKTLEDFGVTGKIVGWQPGPVVTVFEYQPEAGVKQSKILGLLDDIALSLKVDSIFIHPIPGKRALGIQVPNTRRDSVLIGDVLASEVFQKNPSPLTFAMGKTINGTPYCSDLTAMPHLLAAGATGTGKSVAINALLCSIIMKSSPDDVRMILVDPKMLELSVYDGIPHLLMPVITEPDRASIALKWAANEMERRYKLMQHAQVRNIGGFNQFWDTTAEERKTQIRGLMSDETIGRLPYILLVIDELADLMLTAPKDVESSIQRLAQKARASGIHMVLATQRPSVDVITGVIKANLPCRLSFQVVSKHDSRTILDQVGSEKLLGKGDILLQRPGAGRLERLQGSLVTDEEVLALVASAKSNYQSSYDERAMGWIDEEVTRSSSDVSSDDISALVDGDPKWDEAINIAKTHGVVSASFLQRHLKIGYNRAARIVEAMEAQGLVAKADGAKPRRWLGSTS